MTDGRPLLDLQTRDTTVDQLRHQREHLPERAELVDCERRRRALDAEASVDDARHSELAGEQRRLEDDVARIRAKIASEQARESTMTSPRDLQAVEAEIASLARRADTQEDRILELMEELEPIDEIRSAQAAEHRDLVERIEVLTTAIGEAESSIDDQLARELADRDRLVAAVEPGLLATYTAMRDRLRGTVIGRLDGDRCTACMLTLPPVEAERIRDQPDGSAVPCECGRALIIR